jgi:hypothetical protein
MRAVAWESFSVSPRSEEGKEEVARRGRYAFRTTMDAPKPIFAKTARRPEKGHMGDEEGRRKKQREEKEPSAAKPNSNGLRYEAEGIELGKTSELGIKAYLYLQFRPWI